MSDSCSQRWRGWPLAAARPTVSRHQRKWPTTEQPEDIIQPSHAITQVTYQHLDEGWANDRKDNFRDWLELKWKKRTNKKPIPKWQCFVHSVGHSESGSAADSNSVRQRAASRHHGSKLCFWKPWQKAVSVSNIHETWKKKNKDIKHNRNSNIINPEQAIMTWCEENSDTDPKPA